MSNYIIHISGKIYFQIFVFSIYISKHKMYKLCFTNFFFTLTTSLRRGEVCGGGKSTIKYLCHVVLLYNVDVDAKNLVAVSGCWWCHHQYRLAMSTTKLKV